MNALTKRKTDYDECDFLLERGKKRKIQYENRDPNDSDISDSNVPFIAAKSLKGTHHGSQGTQQNSIRRHLGTDWASRAEFSL
jgi:hypothetical protein